MVDVLPFRTEGERPGGQVAEWLEKWNGARGQAPITIERLEEKNLLKIVTTPIILFMAAMTWNAEDKAGAPLVKAEIYERFFLQIAAGKCRQDQDQHGPVLEASKKLLERLEERGEIELPKPRPDESTARAWAMSWLMGRVAWEGQRRAQKGHDLTLTDVTNILDGELDLRNDRHVVEMIRVGVLLVLQADRQGGNDRILFGHKSFREFLVARYWAGQLRRIVLAKRRDQAALEKKLLGARLLGYDDETFDFLVQILNGPAWDDDRKELIEWAEDCFNDETPDPEASSWLEDRRPVFREAALAIGSSVQGAKGIKAKTRTTLRSMLAWFWLAGVHAIVVAPGLRAERADLDGATLTSANLRGADLTGATFEDAYLMDSNLQEANLDGAYLLSAKLAAANLEGANLKGALLAHTMLFDSDLAGADLTGANLEGANLEGANLRGANLEVADLDGVRHDETTKWPDNVTIQDGKVIVPPQ